jgi:hypothetical protein
MNNIITIKELDSENSTSIITPTISDDLRVYKGVRLT